MPHPILIDAVSERYQELKEEGYTDREIYNALGISRSYFYEIKQMIRS